MSTSWVTPQGASHIQEKAINERKVPAAISCPTPQTYYRDPP